MADFDVINHPAGFGQAADGFCFQSDIIEIAVFEFGGDALQFAVQTRGFGAFGFAEVLVAAGKRSPSGARPVSTGTMSILKFRSSTKPLIIANC